MTFRCCLRCSCVKKIEKMLHRCTDFIKQVGKRPTFPECNFHLCKLMLMSSATEKVRTCSPSHHWNAQFLKAHRPRRLHCHPLSQGPQSWFEKSRKMPSMCTDHMVPGGSTASPRGAATENVSLKGLHITVKYIPSLRRKWKSKVWHYLFFFLALAQFF